LREEGLPVHRVLVVVWTVTRVVAAVLLLGWASLHLRRLDNVIGVVLPEWIKPAGIVLLVVGGAVVLLCGGMLSTPGIIPTKFVVLGPFRYVRNPMSLGVVAMQCQCKFFTPRSDLRRDGASAENYLRDKFAQHRCSQSEGDKLAGLVKEAFKTARSSCPHCGHQLPPSELGRISMTRVRCTKCGGSLLQQSASA
jgi:ribosomal protein S27AE